MLPASPLIASSLAAALPPHPGLGESIVFQFNGLIVVFLALCMIWGALELMGLYFRRQVRRPKPVPAAPPATTVAPGLSPAKVAAITASICVVLGGRFRIRAIVPQPANLDWAHEGRRQIFASHKVR